MHAAADLRMSSDEVPLAAVQARFANLLVARRSTTGERISVIAGRSDGSFDAARLRAIEQRHAVVDVDEMFVIAGLYGADLGDILGGRHVVEVDPTGALHTGGVAEAFAPGDSDAMLLAYLRLVRRLRRAERAAAVELRRDDVEVLAASLGSPAAQVLDRLADLMGASRAKRTSMAALLGAGAAVVGLVSGAAALSPDGAPSTMAGASTAGLAAAGLATAEAVVNDVPVDVVRDAFVFVVPVLGVEPAVEVVDDAPASAPSTAPVRASGGGGDATGQQTVPVDVPIDVPIDVDGESVAAPPLPTGTAPAPIEVLVPNTPVQVAPPPPLPSPVVADPAPPTTAPQRPPVDPPADPSLDQDVSADDGSSASDVPSPE
jgi:hypothetical protein